MDKKIKVIYLILILTLNFSCVEKNSMNNDIYSSELITTLNKDKDTLKFNSGIRAILQDSKGNYWFGSLQEGVAVYNGKSFNYFTINEGLTDNQIHSIQEDKQGVIWFNTQTGVSSYDGERITNHTKGDLENSQNSLPVQGVEPLHSAWMKFDNDLWFEAGNKSGVYRFDGQQLHYLDLPPQKVLNPHDNLFAVTDISEGKNNMIWFATYAGVFGYDGNDFTIINDETLGYDRKTQALHIRSIFEDSKGRLWIGNNGIGVLLKEGNSIINFSNKHRLIYHNSKGNAEKSAKGTLEHVFIIAEDNKGNIWFGDRDAGIWRYDGNQFKNYAKNDGLKNDFALSIYEDRNSELWFGMANGSIYKFNSKTFEKKF
ncbi:MAG: diguanylate cyclase [Flavobacterium psychrophilum]|nr:MAG: diguanylate cyclase [Flavobacterium psychrophilum]